jgi:hypothetical protein
MSDAIRRGAARARNRTLTLGALLVVAGAATAALLSTGAEARSAAVPSNAEPPAVTGTPVSGETLTASTGSWTGTPPISYAFAWQRCDAGGSSCASIAGETSQTYLVTPGDVGSTLRVLVTATNGEGSESAPSAPTAVVTAQSTPVNTAEPLISGSAVEGSTLTTTTGTWSGTAITFAYQWVRCGTDGGLPDGSNCPSIAGGTSSGYTPTSLDIGKRLRVQVTASNGAGTATATANPTDVVTQSTATGAPRNTAEPSISGTLTQARVLVATIGTWAGETPLSFAYQWVRCGADGGLADGSNCTFISAATSSTYVLTADDVGSRMRVRVTGSNALGSQTAASNATAAVQSTSTTTPPLQGPVLTRLPTILGTAARGETLTATTGIWTGTAPLLFAYEWLRCGADGGQATGSDCTAITGATGTQYAPAADDVGRRLRVRVTARNTVGTATAVSDATALVGATGTAPPPTSPALPPGAVRLANGKYSIPVTSVSLPERLVIDQIVFAPNPVRSRTRPLELRVHVVDTRGYMVRGALVFVRSTPLLTSAPGEQPTGRDGSLLLRLTPKAEFPLRDGVNVQFWIRARKQTDPLLAGVSNRRLVQVATAG